jgi:hypothetical protein
MAKQNEESEPVGALKLRPAARYIGGVSQMTMRRLIDKGAIVPCRNLRHLLIPISELDRWLAEGRGIPARRAVRSLYKGGRPPKSKGGKTLERRKKKAPHTRTAQLISRQTSNTVENEPQLIRHPDTLKGSAHE